MEISVDEGKACGFGNHAVFIVPNFFVQVAEGVRLALRLWLPSRQLLDDHFAEQRSWKVFHGCGEDEGQFPAVLEYLPYRKDDVTAVRDFRRHTWTASHGYVVARADIRGTGDSDGLYNDEYTPEELGDGRSVIGWLSSQPWSNGRVGVYGKSWGGFNGLQLAEMNCPGLAAVISIYSTDDRYNTDVHYTGGCVHGSEALTWSSFMFTINSLPPSPAARPDDWKDIWRRRLENLQPWVNTWMRHQTFDSYWQRGSICFSFDKIRVPILSVGGWRDGYGNAVFRLSDNLPQCCAILGPWSHQWPDMELPGPAVHFVRECLRWWDLHLKGKGSSPARFRIFARTDTERHVRVQQGDWLSASSSSQLQRLKRLYLSADKQLSSFPTDWTSGEVPLSNRAECGLPYSEWLSYGDPDEAPDQQMANALASVWTLAELQEDAEVLGRVEVILRLRANSPSDRRSVPVLGVRVCDLDPATGRQSLVTWGALNLNLQTGQAVAQQFCEGEVKLRLRAVSYRIRKGHRILLALSSCLWPIAWHCGAPIQLYVVGSKSNQVSLPLLDRAAADACNGNVVFTAPLEQPIMGPPPPSTEDTGEQVRLDRFLEDDFVNDRYTNHCKFVYGIPTELFLPDGYDLFLSWVRHYRHSIGKHDCSSPNSSADHQVDLRWPKHDVAVRILTENSLASDGNGDFQTQHRVVATVNGVEFFSRTYTDSIANQTAF